MADRSVKDPLETCSSPECFVCGEPLAGFQSSFFKLPVQAKYSPVFNEVIFVVDPDVPLIVQALPNGQLVIRLRDQGTARSYVEVLHVECERALMAEYYDDYERSDDVTERDEVFLGG